MREYKTFDYCYTQNPKAHLLFTAAIFIHVIKHSLSYAFSVSYKTSSEVTQYRTHPLFNATTKTLVRARNFRWDVNKGVKPIMDLMKDNILESCLTMQFDDEICDIVLTRSYNNKDIENLLYCIKTQ